MAKPVYKEQDERKIAKREIDNAEKKYKNLLTKRDELKEGAYLVRDERDLLNNERKTMVESVRELRAKRKNYVDRIKQHKRKRNELQKQAKDLIASKKSKRSNIFKNLGGEIETVKSEIKVMDIKHQTVPMKLSDENKLIDEIRSKKKNLSQMEKQLPKQEKLSAEVMTIDEKIDQLFKRADKEHEKVVKLSDESQEFFDEVKKKNAETTHLINKANQKHEEYMKIMDRSGYFHERAMEMRNKVVTLRREQRTKQIEARKVIQKQNVSVKTALEDEKKLNEAADSAVKTLLKKGKIEM